MSQYIEADDFIHGVRELPRTIHRTDVAVEPTPKVSAVSTGMDEFVQYCSTGGPSATEWQTELGREFADDMRITKERFQDLAGIPRKSVQFQVTQQLTEALAHGIAEDVDKEILRALITTITKNKG